MRKLDKIYLRESTALQICVRNKLERVKLKDYTETSEFYSDFEKLIIELKNAGATVSKKEKLNYLLRTLPSSLSYIGDLIDVIPEGDQTVDYVINKIKMHEERERDENPNSRNKSLNSNVFKSEIKRDRTCYKCGKNGHYQYECMGQSNAGVFWRSSRGDRQQLTRGGARHQPQQQRDGNNQGRGGGGYRDRGSYQRGRGGPQRRDRQSADQGSMTFVTEVENNVGHNIEVNNCENQLE